MKDVNLKSVVGVAIDAVVSKVLQCVHVAYLPFIGEYIGLGNRLKGMANAWSLGYRRIVVLWRSEGWVSAPFDAVFALEDQGKTQVLSSDSWKYKVASKIFRHFLPVSVVQRPFWSFYDSIEAEDINWGYERIKRTSRERILPFFRALKPSADVIERIKSVNLPANIVSVYVRNSDNNGDKANVCAIESFFDIMDTSASNQHFYLSAMCDAVSRRFHSRYGDRIIELPSKDYSSMVDAVADMWLLGEGREMVTLWGSTFPEVAWWWREGRGGAEMQVKLLQVEYNQADRLK